MKHEIKNLEPYTKLHHTPEPRADHICIALSSAKHPSFFNYGGTQRTVSTLLICQSAYSSAAWKDHGLPELCEIPPCRQDQDYANSREATGTSGNRFHLLPAQIIFSSRTHLLPNYIVQHPYISMYSRSQPASTYSTAHDATVGERNRKQKISDLRTSPGPLWRLHTRFDLWN